MKKKLLIITDGQVLRLIDAACANRLVEFCFRNFTPGKVRMPAKVYLDLPKGDFRAMPAYTRLRGGVAGVKWICVFPLNAKRRLPTVIGTLLLNDTSTGQVLAVMEANVLTALRTGGAGAVASKFLGPVRPRVLALIGAGVQAQYQLRSHAAWFPSLKEVRVWSPAAAESAVFVRRFKNAGAHGRAPLLITVKDLPSCVRGADIVTTVTPSRKPLVRAEWLKPGCHVNAIGADAPGKQELEIDILKNARVFVDDWEQAGHSGEINVAVSKGRLRRADIAGTLTDAVLGRVPARKSPSDITVFDSTGLAIQDLVLADHAYKAVTAR